MFAARGIIRPIEQLRRLAAEDSATDPMPAAATGLPETDMVARALITAAAERRPRRADLAESESRFRALFEKSASGTILLDPRTTRIVDCNEVAAVHGGLFRRGVRGPRYHRLCSGYQPGPDPRDLP